MRLHKRKTNRDNKQKFKYNLGEYAAEAVKPYFAPQNMFNWAFLEHK